MTGSPRGPIYNFYRRDIDKKLAHVRGTVASTTGPKFASPPVVEAVLGVQFEPLYELQPAHVGLFWGHFRDRFPKAETHPPLEHTIEQFRNQKPLQVQLQVGAGSEAAAMRFWFISTSGTELIQIQQDRLIVNWRRGDTHDAYPHFEQIRSLFGDVFEWFRTFIDQEGLGIIRPDQCEVTYIDHIAPDAVWQSHSEMSKVVPAWSPPEDPEIGQLEEARVQARYLIPDERGRPLGRLAVTVAPAYRRVDGKPIFVMTTTARGRPDGDGIGGITRFFDRGHDSAVRAFYLMTSKAMHQAWGEIP